MDRRRIRWPLWGLSAGVMLGASWLFGGGLLGPGASALLLPILAAQRTSLTRFITAAGYYGAGSSPIIAAVVGYWGAQHMALGAAAWLVASLLLAAPWMLAGNAWGLCAALACTALPPLGVIGWLSPLNGAGVLFPGLGGLGLAMLCLSAVAVYWRRPWGRAILLVLGFLAVASNLSCREPPPPPGWVGVSTHLMPARRDIFRELHNNQDAIAAGLQAGRGAHVVVLAEAILDDWRPGTRQQFALAVPPGQRWIIGADTASSDVVVLVTHARAAVAPMTRAAGLLLGGNWLPGSHQTLQPAWWQSVFRIEGRRVWAALCIEQLQPWTWLEAMAQRPDVVFAMSNGWWDGETPSALLPPGRDALSIERASTRAWSRLLRVPIIWADNDPGV